MIKRNNIDFYLKILFWLDFFFLESGLCVETKKPFLWGGIAQARGCFFCRSVWCCCWIPIQQLREPRDDWQLLLPEDTTLGVCKASNGCSTFPHCFSLQEWQTFMLLSFPTRLHSRKTPEHTHILANTGRILCSSERWWCLTADSLDFALSGIVFTSRFPSFNPFYFTFVVVYRSKMSNWFFFCLPFVVFPLIKAWFPS